MLKRTTGLSLLTLLVITGLAGTINNFSISGKERKFAITLMKDTRDAVIDEVKGLSDAQLEYRESPDKWSVKECLYHIAAAEKALWEGFETAMKAPANPEKRAEIKVTDEKVVAMVEDRVTVKVKAPEPLQPANTGYKSAAEALADFKATRTEHIKYMKTTTEDLRNHVSQMPVGPIDGYQFYLFIAAHTNRHTQQIQEIKKSAGFPSK
jgi:hypothetical protein